MPSTRIAARILSPFAYLAFLLAAMLEELPQPTILDHLRRCALLYLVLVPLGVVLLAFANFGDPGEGGALATMLCVAAGYAVVVDASLLFVVGRCSDGPRTGSYT